MGNQLSGIAPSQILPVENYLADLNNRSFKELVLQRSLGSTRFLKVVMCFSEKGPIVVKIFVIHDSSLSLNQQKKKIKEVADRLNSAVNCLPFHRVELTERAAFITRQYIKSSLYDRISTRPFLSPIEKKWLAFQFLCALKQCHEEKICHGDIKLENLLVSSWSWLVLSDFATYKPVLLPEDNPTDFTYYFDTSRRRVCYIAPERFIRTLQKEEEAVMKDMQEDVKLTPAMDMFSAGCVLAELFTEGFYPFNLMQLLQYRVDAYYPSKVLERITDIRVRRIVEMMIKKDPSERQSAASFLEEERGKLFPQYFYTFLWPFCKQFAVPPGLSADERIRKINDSLPDILTALGLVGEQEDSNRPKIDDSETLEISHSRVDMELEYQVNKSSLTKYLYCNTQEEENIITSISKSESLIMLTSLVTSCVRALHYSTSKLIALTLLKTISKYVPSDVILDRILPYIFNLLKDPEPRVRAESVFVLKQCLSLVSSVPRSEVNIFLEYIFPHLNEITQDPAVIVRQAEAENIASIADTALRFIEYCSQNWSNYSHDSEVETLQDIVQQKLAKLFSDSSNIVKRTLIEETMNTLCLFFGKEKANDVLLSHLITFLNEKKDHHLRLSFYKNITGIAAYMGLSCAPILKPLLLQGLSDTEEMVTVSALDTMSTLIEIGIFPDHTLHELIKDSAPLLIHPNPWIRQAVVGLIVTMSKVLPFLDIFLTVSTSLQPYNKKKVLQFDKEVSILSSLKDPLPRGVFDTLLKGTDITLVLNVLEEASTNKTDVRLLPSSLGEGNQPIKTILKRLLAGGLTNSMLQLILVLRDHLVKVHRHRKAMETLQVSKDNQQPGLIKLDDGSGQQPVIHKFKLISNENSVNLSSTISSSSQGIQKSASLTMNEEWQTMFGNVGSEEDQRSTGSALSTSKQSSSMGASLSSQCLILDQSTTEKSVARSVTSCQRDLENLLHMKREELFVFLQSKKTAGASPCEGTPPPHKWRPKGHLVAHLHEHKGAITRLVSLKGTTLYASSSKDGTVKVWDCSKTERTFPVNRSKFTYNQQKGVITTMAYCSMQESIASGSDNQSIHVFKLDRQSLLVSRHLEKVGDGYAIDMNYMEAGSHSVLTYSTVYGKIVGWDLRSPGNAWVAENAVKKGVITSYAIDSGNNWLACGTSSGYTVCWDLRFMLPISVVKHPHARAVQRLKMHPSEPSWVMTSTRANNEIIFWDMETQSRTKTLWASPNPPFSPKPSRNWTVPDNWVHGLLGSKTESGSVFVITVGTDSRIRYWDLENPESSFILSHPALYNSQCNFTYKSRVIDGTEVIMETMSPNPNPPPAEESPRRGPDQPPTGHIETITDVIMVTQPQRMIISSGFDGTIKMWK